MRRLPLALLLLALGACFYPADRGRALEARVDQLSADNARLSAEGQKQREQLAATLPLINEKVGEVGRALESLDKASRRSSADIGVQLQKTVEDVARLRGLVEEYLHRISELEGGLARLVEEDKRRQAAAAQSAEAAAAEEARRKAEELKRPTDKKEFLALARERAATGEHAQARQLYQEFLRKWSRDALVGEAYFGLGESFYAEERCREALSEYGKVVQEHPKTPSAPTAYLRSAECFKRLKMLPESRMALEELVASHPKSEAAKTARAQLAELDKASRKAPAPKKGKK